MSKRKSEEQIIALLKRPETALLLIPPYDLGVVKLSHQENLNQVTLFIGVNKLN